MPAVALACASGRPSYQALPATGLCFSPPNPTPRRCPPPPTQAMAQAFAPCVAWLPLPPRPARALSRASDAGSEPPGGGDDGGDGGGGGGSSGRVVALEGEEAHAIVSVLESLITRFTNIFG
jgi:hypothetical protein